LTFKHNNCKILARVKNMKKIKYNIILHPEPEGGFTVTVPSLPGCVSYGKNLNEARKMAEEAIELYLECLRAHKQSIPNDEQAFITTIDVNSPCLANSRLKYA